ncbi:odorant receptor 85f-like [Scaptodrosophila lebanonensis]|uniref:Odorant receptor n=1 Tax=Drosophila lebanonensis TaxID=7225 RepID=A0A6J2TN00_DROLE|nr:odorant receptor 85f-like [Scaptodrosophila lebanonensis]
MAPVLYSFDDFFWMPETAFRLMGYDALRRSKSAWLELLMWVFYIFCGVIHTFFNCIMIYRLYEMDFKETHISLIMRYATEITFVINSDTKFVTYLWHRSSIQRVHARLAELYPQTTPMRLQYQVEKYYWSRALRILIALYFGASALMVEGPLLESMYMYVRDWLHMGRQHAQFSYLHYYPFISLDAEKPSLVGYIGTYLGENLHTLVMVNSNMGLDLWMVCFVGQLCMHFDYIGRTLQAYQPDRQHDVADCEFLAHLVVKHQRLMEIQKEINSIFGESLILNLITTAGVFCTVGVYILLQGLDLEGVSYLIFIFTAIAQLYLICYYGELITSLSTYVGQAAYSHTWYNASQAYKKQLLLIMLRSQRPAELSAMGFLALSVDTFKQLMSVSYRVFALIRTMIQ